MSRTCDTDIPGFWVNVHQVCHNRDLALNAVSDLADATFSGRREM